MNKNYILVKVTGNYSNIFIKKCLNNQINLKEIKYLKDKSFIIKCTVEDYQNIKRITKDYKLKKISNLGLKLFIDQIKENGLIVLSLVFIITLITLFSKVIVNVEVIHSDEDIRKIILFELEENGIKPLAFKKNYSKTESIKNKILDTHKNKIEWMEIVSEGMNYIIRVEERKIEDKIDNSGKCHIVANKNAIIKEMVHSSGEVKRDFNDYVEKGDIIISGDITYNNEIITSLCAQGIVYGETWYTVNVNVPFNYQEKIKTGKIWHNFKYKNKKILNSKYQDFEEEEKKLFNLFKQPLILVKEHALKITNKKYTIDEASKIALTKALESVEIKLKEKEEIITKNVLKKTVNNSTIELEVFVAVKEIISTSQKYE